MKYLKVIYIMTLYILYGYNESKSEYELFYYIIDLHFKDGYFLLCKYIIVFNP